MQHVNLNHRDSNVKVEVINGYTLKYGYVSYDENKYGFSNPGFLNIHKSNNLIYTDSFKGEGPVDIESLGIQELSGRKLVFRLNYGTEACDYVSTSKYYVAFDSQVKFIKECSAVTGGDLYSSKIYEHILPSDKSGLPNNILFIEGQIFHEKDQPNQFDTTYIKFVGGVIKTIKPTDNLSKVK